MKFTKGILPILFLLILIHCKSKEHNRDKLTNDVYKKSWKQLFNGKDLDNWVVKINKHELGNNFKNTFGVENGLLKVSYDGYDNFSNQFGHLFYKTPFTNYKLRLAYRFMGEQAIGGEAWAAKNSGVMIHSQSPESMLVDQAFPLSLEVQLLGGVVANELRPTGNLCTPATMVSMKDTLVTKHCINSSSDTYYGEEWVYLEITVTKEKIIHKINGKTVISYATPVIGGQFLSSTSKEIQLQEGKALEGGYISLQSESHPIAFKNIEILEL